MLAGALVSLVAAAQDAPAERRPAAAIVAEFDANPSPGFVLDQDPEEGERLIRTRLTKQCECAWELFEGWPDHARLPELLFARIMNELNFFEDLARVAQDAQRLLAKSRRPEVRVLARFASAQAALGDERQPSKEAALRVEEALREPGEIPQFPCWRPLLLVELATSRTADPARQRELLERAGKEADGAEIRDVIARAQRSVGHVGEPLALAFDDALGNGRFDLASARGKFAIVHVAYFVWGAPGKQFESLRAALPQLKRAGVTVVSSVTTLGGDEDDAWAKDAAAAGVSWPLQRRVDEGVSGTSPLGLDPPSFVLVDGEGRVAGVYVRLAPLLERVESEAAGGVGRARPSRRRAY